MAVYSSAKHYHEIMKISRAPEMHRMTGVTDVLRSNGVQGFLSNWHWLRCGIDADVQSCVVYCKGYKLSMIKAPPGAPQF